MNLIVIYGPPAVGKLTVAKALAEKIGYKLLHNHLSVDLVTSIFDFDSEQLPVLLNKIRLDILEEAAKSDIQGIILTLVYESAEAELGFIERLAKLIRSNAGNIYFVRLYTDKATLEKRIIEESRAIFNKPRTPEILAAMMDRYNIFATIPNTETLSIDNIDLSPGEVTNKIINHYKIK